MNPLRQLVPTRRPRFDRSADAMLRLPATVLHAVVRGLAALVLIAAWVLGPS